MARKKVVLIKYENIATGDIYFGYPIKDAVTKDIDGIIYLEVTDSLTKPKQRFVKMDNIRKIGEVNYTVEK